MVYPESRVLTIEQKSEMYGLFGLKVPAARIVCHFETKYGLKLQSQDVHNHRMRYRKEMSDGLSEEDATCQLFQRVIERDPGATVEVICDTTGVASIIFLQTTEMKKNFAQYPYVIFLDTTYKVNARSMPLFSIMVVDGNKSGQTAAYGLVVNECAETITQLMEVFVKHNLECSKLVKTVIIDKDFSEIKAVKNVLPETQIVICKFHVVQAVQRALKGYTPSEKEAVMALIQKILQSSDEKEYWALVEELNRQCPKFMEYYNSCWHNIRESWAGCYVRQHVTYGNLTNNFVESHHQKIKYHIGAHTSIPDLIHELVILSEKRQSKANVTKSRLTLKRRLVTTATDGISDVIEKIYKCVAPYPSKIMKRELLKSSQEIFLIDGNKVSDRNGKSYMTEVNSCTCYIAQCQKIVCRHIFSLRAQSNLDLFQEEDVPRQHRLDIYTKKGTAPHTNVPFTVSVNGSKPRVFSKNEKFRKAKDTLNQICDTLSDLGQVEFSHWLDMFGGIVDAIKSNKDVVWFTTDSDGQILTDTTNTNSDVPPPNTSSDVPPPNTSPDVPLPNASPDVPHPNMSSEVTPPNTSSEVPPTKSQTRKKRKLSLVNVKEGFLRSFISSDLVPIVMKGNLLIDSYMINDAVVSLDRDFDVNSICEMFTIKGWEAFQELSFNMYTNMFMYPF